MGEAAAMAGGSTWVLSEVAAASWRMAGRQPSAQERTGEAWVRAGGKRCHPCARRTEAGHLPEACAWAWGRATSPNPVSMWQGARACRHAAAEECGREENESCRAGGERGREPVRAAARLLQPGGAHTHTVTGTGTRTYQRAERRLSTTHMRHAGLARWRPRFAVPTKRERRAGARALAGCVAMDVSCPLRCT